MSSSRSSSPVLRTSRTRRSRSPPLRSASPSVAQRKRPTEADWDSSSSEENYKRRRSTRRPTPPPPPPQPRRQQQQQRYACLPPDPLQGMPVSVDASMARMRERRRALVLGLFKVVTRTDACAVEEAKEFLECVDHFRGRRFRYVAVPKGFQGSNYPRTRYSAVRGDWPGCGDRYHVIWTTQAGDIKIDRSVKLHDIESVQGYEIDGLSANPKSLWFSLVDPRRTSTPEGEVTFDANLFWSVGLLYKHFRTCGIEVWDHELSNLFRMETRPLPSLMTISPLSLPPPIPLMHLNVPPPLRDAPPRRQAQAPPPTPPTALITLANHAEDVQNNNQQHEFTLGERYTGCVMEWRGSYGFLSCTLVPGKIFLHSHNLTAADGGFPDAALVDPIGLSVNFELAADAEVGRRFKAVKAHIYG